MSKGHTVAELALMQATTRAEKRAISIAAASTTYHFCEGRYPTLIGSDWYSPKALSLPPIPVTEPGQTVGAVVLDDLGDDLGDDSLAAHALANEIHDDGLSDRVAILYRLILDEVTGVWEPVEAHTLRVSDESGDSSTVTLELSAWGGMYPAAGLAECSRLCCLWFGGTWCQYSGSHLTCNHTWEDCTTRANTAHFAGWLHAPAPGETIAIGAGGVVVAAGGRGATHGTDLGWFTPGQRVYRVNAQGPVRLPQPGPFNATPSGGGTQVDQTR